MKKFFRLRHEPKNDDRQSWLDVEEAIKGLSNEVGDTDTVSYTIIAPTGPSINRVVPHSLGKIPSEIQVISIHPLDSELPFSVWEPNPVIRTKTSVTIRTDGEAGDIVRLRIKA